MRTTPYRLLSLAVALILLSLLPGTIQPRRAFAQTPATKVYLPVVSRPGFSVLDNWTTYRSGSYLEVVGEVVNDLNVTVWESYVAVRLMNGTQVVQTTVANVNTLMLKPGMKSCFRAEFPGNPAWDSVTFTPTQGSFAQQYTHDMLYGQSAKMVNGLLEVSGAIQNPGYYTKDLWFMGGTVYSNEGKVLDCQLTLNSGVIRPGEAHQYVLRFLNPNLNETLPYVLQPEASMP